MTKKINNDITPKIVHATKEARELYRIRNSFTFNLGIELIRSIKNPFLFIVFPFRILRLLRSQNPQPPIADNNFRSGILIIGVDRIGENYSMQAHSLAKVISKSDLGEVTLFNNSTEPPTNFENLEWYRIPPVREKNKSRKEWNIMVERLLSSVLSISQPEHVIFFGDYLYRGIVDALEPLDSSIPITWFQTNSLNIESISTKKLPNIKPIALPEFSKISHTPQSIHRLLRRPENETILLLDIAPENKSLISSIVQLNTQLLVTAIQREYTLPKEIDLVVRMKEVIGMQLEGNVKLVIDDKSPLLPSLSVMNVPCLFLRTGKQLSPIINEMVRDMELKGTLIVVRRKTSAEIVQSLEYLVSIPNGKFHSESGGITTSPIMPTNYVIKWLENSSQSYN